MGGNEGVLEGIVPSERKSEGRVHETSCVACKALFMGKIRSHFSKGGHDLSVA